MPTKAIIEKHKRKAMQKARRANQQRRSVKIRARKDQERRKKLFREGLVKRI